MGEFAASDAGQQRLGALQRANRVRLARAELKKQIRAGALAAAEVVLHCPWEAERMAVSEVIMSQKRWGATRCRRALVSVGVPENKPVGTLTDRQRAALVATLGGHARLRDAQELGGSDDKPRDKPKDKPGDEPSGGAGRAVRPTPPKSGPTTRTARPLPRERALSAV